jgi:bla regulator protein BlaR1
MSAALINHLWQSTLFAAGVALITLALRRNAAAVRHGLWLVASLKFLAPFSVLYQLGAWAGLPVIPTGEPNFLSQAIELSAPVLSPSHSLVVLGPSSAQAWGSLAGLTWAAGAALLAVRWWLAWHAADSIVRAARPVPGSPPDARVTEAAIEPAVARVFHPVVLLPVALLGRLTGPQLGAVLAHEREHIARRDNLVAHLQRLVETVFWFHPMVWWIGRQLVEERERACDEAVLEKGHDPREYAEGILAVCRHCHQFAHASGTSSALSGDLTRRIRAIVADAPPVAIGYLKAFGLGLAALALTTAPLLAGAAEGTLRRLEQLAHDTRNLWSADLHVRPASGSRDRSRVVTEAHAVVIRNSSIRELVALTYGVEPASVVGGGDWLDSPRYDIRAEVRDPVADPDNFDPAALRAVVNKLLATRFDLRVHVNRRCQEPCGLAQLTEASR